MSSCFMLRSQKARHDHSCTPYRSLKTRRQIAPSAFMSASPCQQVSSFRRAVCASVTSRFDNFALSSNANEKLQAAARLQEWPTSLR